MGRKKPEELSPIAREYKKTYEQWFIAFLVGGGAAMGTSSMFPPFLLIAVPFSVYCLYLSQKNYSFYKAAKNEGMDTVR